MSDHPNQTELLAFVLGQLDGAERHELEAHLGECELCEGRLAREARLEERIGWLRAAGWEPRASRRRPYRWLVVPVAVAAAALVLVFEARPRPPAPAPPGEALTLADARAIGVLEATSAPRRVGLSDGSEITLSPGTRIETVDNGARSFGVALVHGRAEFDVRPHGPRRWTVQSERVSVEVIGTRFTVDADSKSVAVAVARGEVAVRGDALVGGLRRLRAGESVRLAPVEVHETIEEPRPPEPAAPALSERQRAALAEYRLGLRIIEQQGPPFRAASALGRAINRGLPSSVNQDAHLRLAYLLVHAGDERGASEVAAHYLARYPEGVYGKRMRALVLPPSDAPAPSE